NRRTQGLVLSHSVLDNFTLPNLRLFQRWGAMQLPAAAKAVKDFIQRLSIKTDHPRKTVGLLSGGNQQKVVMAKWLLSQGEVLIFDEPTRGIDVGAKADIHQLIRDLAAQGKAVIVISSELPEVLALCHRILVMKEGRITGELHGPGITQAQLMHLATLPQALDPT
ncbi:MAG: Ribose import ATP-binding protein RbsA, partial [Pseudomonadota bacterium]